MFRLDEALVKALRNFNRGWQLAPAGPNVSLMGLCNSGCGNNVCMGKCTGSCKNTCTRSCKGNKR